MTIRTLLVALSFATLAGAQSSAVTLSGDQLVEGRDSILSLTAPDRDDEPLAGVTVVAVYRENAHHSIRHTQQIGTTEPDGTLTWTPTQAGVVVLEWTEIGAEKPSGKKQVSVRHDGIPGAGIAVALIAGLLLLGGSLRFLLQMLSTDE